jgi:arylsulfatase A-like enzyme
MIPHGTIVFALCQMTLTALYCFPAEAKNSHPNVVIMLADNVGWGDIGVYGGGALRGALTPRIDSIATDGLRLLNGNVEPYCTPTRAALMSGRYTVRTHSTEIGGLSKSEITLAELFSSAGYATAVFGKWDLGPEEPGFFPTDRGFDEWYGIPQTSHTAMWDTSFQYDPELAPLQRVLESAKGNPPRKVKDYDEMARRKMDGELTARALTFMKKNVDAEKPFFLYLSFTQTHFPTLPHPDFDGRTGNGPYADALAELDYRTAQVLDAITRLGVREETVVIWLSDNGPSEYVPHGSPGYWRGSAHQALEGSVRVPFMIRWPGKIKPGVSNEIVHVTDVLPSLARVAGYALPSDRVIDGADQMDFFMGKQEKSSRDGFPIYGRGGKLLAYKWQNWKVHFTNVSGVPAPYELPSVYNVVMDPREEQPMDMRYFWVVYAVGSKLKTLNVSLQK